jgi:2-amino-4-hydroxy-6-hydroxymethyldihydropteridine diphosphokinase
MILIGLGSSLPFCGAEPQEIVPLAIRSIRAIGTVARVSRLYRSPAWPDGADPPFVNAAIALDTPLDPDSLLRALHAIEASFGRARGRRNAPRTLDLDLLAYRRLVRRGPDGLQLPHPGIAERAFVLAPLCDIAPAWTCPATGRSARAMLAALPSGAVRPIDS